MFWCSEEQVVLVCGGKEENGGPKVAMNPILLKIGVRDTT